VNNKNKKILMMIMVMIKVKVKLSLYLNKHHAMGANWGSGSIVSLIL
jgi:hypothetical protein